MSESTAEQAPKRRGRPPGSTAEPSVVTSVRLPQALHAKFLALGGAKWLQAALKRAKASPQALWHRPGQ